MSQKSIYLFFNILKVGVSVWLAWMGFDLLNEAMTTPDHTAFIYIASGAMIVVGIGYGIYALIQLIRQLVHWKEE